VGTLDEMDMGFVDYYIDETYCFALMMDELIGKYLTRKTSANRAPNSKNTPLAGAAPVKNSPKPHQP